MNFLNNEQERNDDFPRWKMWLLDAVAVRFEKFNFHSAGDRAYATRRGWKILGLPSWVVWFDKDGK